MLRNLRSLLQTKPQPPILSKQQLFDTLLPNYNPNDWQSIVRRLHLIQSAGQNPQYNPDGFTLETAYLQLLQIADQNLFDHTNPVLLYGVLLIQELEDFPSLFPDAYTHLGLKPVHPDGLLEHLLPIAENKTALTASQQAYAVSTLLEYRSTHPKNQPPLSPPYKTLYKLAKRASKTPLKNTDQTFTHYPLFKQTLHKITTEQPSVTLSSP